MLIEIDFASEEAIYLQVKNQIIYLIAARQLKEGDNLPSVRRMAEEIGINMHTVNKAYSVLRDEGFVHVDRRRGAVVCVDMDKIRAKNEMKQNLQLVLAMGRCKQLTKEDVHAIVDEIFEECGGC
ncbi:MAG: GntR family transcriptional regulator [Lachnospiraceae bacterium]|nr:GntR family transcriptional regulator [Lachnospiraceae bacterium]